MLPLANSRRSKILDQIYLTSPLPQWLCSSTPARVLSLFMRTQRAPVWRDVEARRCQEPLGVQPLQLRLSQLPPQDAEGENNYEPEPCQNRTSRIGDWGEPNASLPRPAENHATHQRRLHPLISRLDRFGTVNQSKVSTRRNHCFPKQHPFLSHVPWLKGSQSFSMTLRLLSFWRSHPLSPAPRPSLRTSRDGGAWGSHRRQEHIALSRLL